MEFFLFIEPGAFTLDTVWQAKSIKLIPLYPVYYIFTDDNPQKLRKFTCIYMYN